MHCISTLFCWYTCVVLLFLFWIWVHVSYGWFLELDGSIWNQHLSLSLDFSVLLTNHLVFISNNVCFGGWQEQLEAFFVLMGGTDHIQSSFWSSNDSIMCLMLSRTTRTHMTNLCAGGTSWAIRTTLARENNKAGRMRTRETDLLYSWSSSKLFRMYYCSFYIR